MKASELKKILEVSTILGKGFAPITEFAYIDGRLAKMTNGEAYIEIELEEKSPFSGCVLTTQLYKFLNSLKKDIDLDFVVNSNILTINYGKKNKFSVPMETIENFPQTPAVKYSNIDLLCSVNLTLDTLKLLEVANQFASKNDPKFNGIYLKKNKIYSSNREIIYMNDFDLETDSSIFISSNFIKLLSKFKNTFSLLEIFPYGFKASGNNMALYFASYEDVECPNFEDIFIKHKKLESLQITEELKESIQRISLFDEIVNIKISNKSINIFTNNINEVINIDIDLENEYQFKFNMNYLNKLLNNDTLFIMIKDGEDAVSSLYSESDTCKIISSVVL